MVLHVKTHLLPTLQTNSLHTHLTSPPYTMIAQLALLYILSPFLPALLVFFTVTYVFCFGVSLTGVIFKMALFEPDCPRDIKLMAVLLAFLLVRLGPSLPNRFIGGQDPTEPINQTIV